MKRPPEMAEDLVTVEEFYRLVPDGQKADLLDGVIYMASPDSIRANDLTGFLESLLRMYNDAKNLRGRVFVNRVAFRLSKLHAPEPDVAFVRRQRTRLIGKTDIRGAPDVAIEVVSLESRIRDYTEKMQAYQKAGVQEYWIIDPIRQRIEFYRLDRGRYQLVSLEQNRLFRSKVIPGFWLDIHWLLADPLPNAYRCLQQILG